MTVTAAVNLVQLLSVTLIHVKISITEKIKRILKCWNYCNYINSIDVEIETIFMNWIYLIELS